MSDKAKNYEVKVILEEYTVLKDFMSFNKGDIASLKLTLTTNLKGTSRLCIYEKVQHTMYAELSGARLPHKSLTDVEYFEKIWVPDRLTEFFYNNTSLDKSDSKTAAQRLNYAMSSKDNLEYSSILDNIKQLWLSKITQDHIISNM